MAEALYDRIGVGYSAYRRPDPRIEARIAAALGSARTVLNVGAGSGSYEPADRAVVAVEPSAEMVRQRPRGSAPAVRATAEHLPFADASFDAALAVLTLHHWRDWRAGLTQMRCVARERVVLLTWVPDAARFWLVDEYFPEILEFDRRTFPSLEEMADVLGPVDVQPVPIPADCTDGFLGAYWRRPSAYLDAGVRGAISAFARLEDPGPRLARLAADLADGTWASRHHALLPLTELDLGYRLVIAPGSAPADARGGRAGRRGESAAASARC
jgi:SAM-dependent methyltransferase